MISSVPPADSIVPPNADLTCEVDGEVVNFVVELTDPLLDGAELSYTVALPSPAELAGRVACSAKVHLFIDPSECILAQPAEPLSCYQ